jgi:hypothetical protein
MHKRGGAQHVGVEGRRVVIGSNVGDRGGPAFGACDVDGHVESAEPFDRGRDQLLDVNFEPHIGQHEFGPGARRARVADDLSASRGTAAGGDDVIALAGERLGYGPPDTAERPQ